MLDFELILREHLQLTVTTTWLHRLLETIGGILTVRVLVTRGLALLDDHDSWLFNFGD